MKSKVNNCPDCGVDMDGHETNSDICLLAQALDANEDLNRQLAQTREELEGYLHGNERLNYELRKAQEENERLRNELSEQKRGESIALLAVESRLEKA